MKINLFRISGLLLSLSMLLPSCIKNDVVELTNQGSPFVKIIEAPSKTFYFSPFSDVKTFDALSLRRDANSEAELNKSVTVTLKLDTAAISAYNDANSANLELLPDSLYTVGTAFQKTGDLTYTTTFEPGDFAKEFSVSLNGGKWDLSHSYVLPFEIVDAGGLTIMSDKGNLFARISVKNKYDGKYTLTGYHNRSPYNFPYITTMDMVTLGPNTVGFFWPDAGTFGHPIGVGPDPENDLSWYGTAVQPAVVFDANDEVSDVYNLSSAVVITRFDGATGSNVSRYDPATKTMIVHWNYSNNPDRAFFDTLTYIGPR